MSPPRLRPSRPLLLLSAVLVLLAFSIVGIVLRELMRLPEVPQLATQPQTFPPLSRKLAFVVADALRYDYAVDPERAPNLARHMREDTHGELWAGRITMTSASILALGTGQRGDFAEVITNLKAGRTRFDDIINSARRAGMRTGLVGDEVWMLMFGHFNPEVNDDAVMTIDVDNSKQMLAAAHKILESGSVPDILVVHIIATDHQGHAHGMASQRYAEFLRRFDADLQLLFDKIPSDTTVLFLSDHGATDTGAHGSDIPVARRSPFFAYGPGIRKGVDLGSMDQVDMSPTLAALLGVPAPRHARGTVLTELLDVTPERAAALACADAERTLALAKALGLQDALQRMQAQHQPCAQPQQPSETRIQAARQTARMLDQALEKKDSTRGLRGALLLSATLLLMLIAVPWTLRKLGPLLPILQSYRQAGLALLLCAVILILTLQVEKITPPWHNVTRGVLFAASGIALLIGLLRPQSGVRWYARFPNLAWILLPGALAWSYTANTQVFSWIVLLVGTLLILFGAEAATQGGWLFRGTRLGAWTDRTVVIASLAFLIPFAIRQDEPLPVWLGSRPTLLLLLGLAACAAWLTLTARKLSPRPSRVHLALSLVLVIAPLALRRVAPAWLGVGSLLGFPLLCCWSLLRGWPLLALGAGLGAWQWVSRDEEVLPFVATLALAEILGRTIAEQHAARTEQSETDPTNLWRIAVAVAALFSLSFLARVGLQRGLDFTSFDFGAGAFGDPEASSLRVSLSLIWKYVSAELLLILVFLFRCQLAQRRLLLLSFSAVAGIRAVLICLMLFVCRTSYWTAFRTLSDAGPALCCLLASVLLLGAWAAWERVALPSTTRSPPGATS